MVLQLTILRWRLSRKEEQLRRLQQCSQDLKNNQQDFERNECKCLEPSLERKTWAGDQAKQFDQLRESEMNSNYRDIPYRHYDRVFQELENKMKQIQLDIESIRQSIKSLEAQLYN